MKPIKIESKDPYTEIANIIDEWCKKNFYGSFVVTISRDGQIITVTMEELATWLSENDSYFPIGDHKKHWLQWLSQEAKG